MHMVNEDFATFNYQPGMYEVNYDCTHQNFYPDYLRLPCIEQPDDNDIFSRRNLLISFSIKRRTLELQNKLSYINGELEIARIIDNLSGCFQTLINGKYSNYFISDLIKKASKSQKIQIIHEVYPIIDQLAMSEYGSHPIQTLVEKASSKEEINLLINAICKKKVFLKIAKSPNGTHVIQKIICHFNENYRVKINKLIIENILSLSTDIHGVCIVVKYITNCENVKNLTYIVFLFTQYFRFVSENEYGNYAVQALSKKVQNFENLNTIMNNTILENFLNLSMNRFGNHIINNILYKISSANLKKVVDFLSVDNRLTTLYYNEFGNSIVCRLLNAANQSEKELLLSLLPISH